MQISKKKSKETNRVYALRIIKDNIISMELAPGSLISENEISSQLNISRTPVREAIIELSKTGLLEVLPQKGTRVSLIDDSLVDEANFMRMALEKAIAQYACENRKNLDFSTLEENLSMLKVYIKHENSEKVLELDDSFHQTLFSICGKLRCYQYMKNMNTHFDRVRNMTVGMWTDMVIYEKHLAILNAIKAGDSEKALDEINNHLTKYKLHEEELKKVHPEYFL